MPKTATIDMSNGMAAYFEMVEFGKAMMLSSLVERGLTVAQAKVEFARLHKERFMRGDPPGLVARALKAGIWGRR